MIEKVLGCSFIKKYA